MKYLLISLLFFAKLSIANDFSGDFTCLNYQSDDDKSLCTAAYIFSNHDENLDRLMIELKEFNNGVLTSATEKAGAMLKGFNIPNSDEIDRDILGCEYSDGLLKDLCIGTYLIHRIHNDFISGKVEYVNDEILPDIKNWLEENASERVLSVMMSYAMTSNYERLNIQFGWKKSLLTLFYYKVINSKNENIRKIFDLFISGFSSLYPPRETIDSLLQGSDYTYEQLLKKKEIRNC